MFNTIFDSTATGLSIDTALICAATSLILGTIVSFTHMKTSRASKNFLVTLATLPLLVMAVMIMINGNLGTSIAILGAFSLIRSIQGDAKELLSVFFAMMIGLGLGMGHVLFSVVITFIAVVAIFFFSYTNLLEPNKYNRTLKIVVPEDLDYEDIFDDVFKKYTTHHALVRAKTMNLGSLYKLTYEVTLRKNIKQKEFLDEIRVKNCNLKVLLSQPKLDKEM